MRTGSWVPELELAELDLGRGHNASALLHIRAARSLSPYKTDLMRVEGRVLMALEQYDDAVRSFKEAADAAPGDESAQSEYVEALARADRLPEAIDLLEYKLQSQVRTVNIDEVVRLARYWRLLAEDRSGAAQVEALVAARHFYAVVLEDGAAVYWPDVAPEFKHMTHLLQVIPGSPDSWWPVYEHYLTSGGWHRPSTALWTSMDPDGVKLYPGWLEPAGPPIPRELRNLP
jgi:tetratricopeptide (TPR) repeat protein